MVIVVLPAEYRRKVCTHSQNVRQVLSDAFAFTITLAKYGSFNSICRFRCTKAGEDYNIRTTLTNLNAEGIIPNSKKTTTKFSINLSYDITDKFEFYTIINYEDRHFLNNPDQGYGNLA